MAGMETLYKSAEVEETVFPGSQSEQAETILDGAGPTVSEVFQTPREQTTYSMLGRAATAASAASKGVETTLGFNAN